MMEPAELQQQIRAERTAALIINTVSRNGERLFVRALEGLAQRGITVTAAYPVHHPDRLPEVVRSAVQRGHRLIVIGGGDGTVSAVVDYLAYQDVVLGLLPLGTGNSFAHTLHIPLSLRGALDVIATGEVARIDLGRIGDDYFANVAALGFSVSASRMVSTRVKRYLGKLAYAFEGLRLVPRLGAFRCHLRAAERELDFYAHELIIANGCYYGDTVLAADASVTNNQFLVCAMAPVHGWRLVRLWAAFLVGKRTRMPELHCFPTHELWVSTEPPQYIGIDGEETMQTPAHFSVAPRALQVLVPAGMRV